MLITSLFEAAAIGMTNKTPKLRDAVLAEFSFNYNPISFGLYSSVADLEQKASQGDAAAMADLAEYLVTQNPQGAFEWAQKAVNLDNPAGYNVLGYCYLNGIGTKKDKAKAFTNFKTAADKGCADGVNNLGWCYETGTGVKKDAAMASKLYDNASDDMSIPGLINYRNEFAKNNKRVPEYVETLIGNVIKAYNGDAKNIFATYLNIKGTPYEKSRIRTVMAKSDDPVLKNLSDMLDIGDKISARTATTDEIISYYNYVCETELDDSKNNLLIGAGSLEQMNPTDFESLKKAGEIYFNLGHDSKAFVAWGKAIDNGSPEQVSTMKTLANDIAEGNYSDTKANPAVGLKILDYGVKANNSDCMVQLGDYYLNDRHVKGDNDIAFKYLSKAYEMGNYDACPLLGDCYFYGYGTKEDEKKALAIYTVGANNGNIESMNSLGAYYSHYNCRDYNLKKASEAYKKAIEAGSTVAVNRLKSVLLQLEQDEAIKEYMIKTWGKKHVETLLSGKLAVGMPMEMIEYLETSPYSAMCVTITDPEYDEYYSPHQRIIFWRAELVLSVREFSFDLQGSRGAVRRGVSKGGELRRYISRVGPEEVNRKKR